MAKLKEFRFYWKGAWGLCSMGIDTVIEVDPVDNVRLCMIVNGTPVTISINEEELIADLENVDIRKWHLKEYSRDICDGDNWHLGVKYSDTEIQASGYNGYPPGFLRFLKVLHNHGVPHISYENWVTGKAISQSKACSVEKSTFSTYADYVYLKDILL